MSLPFKRAQYSVFEVCSRRSPVTSSSRASVKICKLDRHRILHQVRTLRRYGRHEAFASEGWFNLTVGHGKKRFMSVCDVACARRIDISIPSGFDRTHLAYSAVASWVSVAHSEAARATGLTCCSRGRANFRQWPR